MSTPPDRFPLSLRLAAIAWMLVAAGCVFASLSRTEVLHDDDFMHDISVEDFGWPLTSFERVTFVRKNATKSTSTYKDYFDLSPFLVNSALVALLLCSTAIVFWIFHAQLFRPRFTLRRLLLAFVAVRRRLPVLDRRSGNVNEQFLRPRPSPIQSIRVCSDVAQVFTIHSRFAPHRLGMRRLPQWLELDESCKVRCRKMDEFRLILGIHSSDCPMQYNCFRPRMKMHPSLTAGEAKVSSGN